MARRSQADQKSHLPRNYWIEETGQVMPTGDGRFTVLMPHPERVFRNVLMSWTSGERSARSPWMRMFGNARGWVG